MLLILCLSDTTVMWWVIFLILFFFQIESVSFVFDQWLTIKLSGSRLALKTYFSFFKTHAQLFKFKDITSIKFG